MFICSLVFITIFYIEIPIHNASRRLIIIFYNKSSCICFFFLLFLWEILQCSRHRLVADYFCLYTIYTHILYSPNISVLWKLKWIYIQQYVLCIRIMNGSYAALVFVSLWNFMQRAPAKQYYKTYVYLHYTYEETLNNMSTLHHDEVNKYCGYRAYYRFCACT